MVFYVGLLFVIPLILMLILLFVFWIIILVDSIKRKFKGDSEKVVWILVIILTGFIGALIYYFVIYINDKKKSIKWLWITLLVLFVFFIVLLAFFLSAFYAGVSSV
jgi:hypothetical protein